MLELSCILETPLVPDQRQSHRVELNHLASIRAREGSREQAVVEDLSRGGCAICTSGFYSIGANVFVTIANFQPFVGQIVWRQDGRVGVQFTRPLHQAVVDHIAGTNSA